MLVGGGVIFNGYDAPAKPQRYNWGTKLWYTIKGYVKYSCTSHVYTKATRIYLTLGFDSQIVHHKYMKINDLWAIHGLD
jgi:hypothetical protein